MQETFVVIGKLPCFILVVPSSRYTILIAVHPFASCICVPFALSSTCSVAVARRQVSDGEDVHPTTDNSTLRGSQSISLHPLHQMPKTVEGKECLYVVATAL